MRLLFMNLDPQHYYVYYKLTKFHVKGVFDNTYN